MANDRSQVRIYTDGACSGNPGPGGWGAVLLWKERELRLQGGEADTTNNRMELMAAIKALEALKRPCNVEIYSDSAYLINAFTKGWVAKWQLNGWRTSGKKDVENQALWQRLIALSAVHQIAWYKVKGHSEDKYNTLCDAMAVEESEKYKVREDRDHFPGNIEE
ncbi:MAG: ribonuclease HI [Clostridiales bacterium]|nr:ribonuclease HI [Clostridiales bacterium]